MPGRGKHRVNRAFFRDAAGIHHQYPVGEFGDHTHVVGNDDDGHPRVALQVAQKVEQLRLDRHIQRGCRLIGQQ